ncbi:MAG: DUF58 domain-containing protein [Acidimicrobiia bacterium]
MLTDRGWAALGAALALVVLWVALGEPELLGMGVLLFTATGVAFVFVRRDWPSLRLARRLNPGVVYEGDQVTVTATLTNDGRRSVWNAELVDEVVGLGSARFSAARLRPGETFVATYQILCRPRGLYPVGPAVLRTTDSLTLAQTGISLGGQDRLVVYPAFEELEGFPIVSGQDPTVHATRPEFRNLDGEDFFTLREYQIGDDLRRVHWPSSAKLDELMIRQLETPWESRALVILDPRRGAYRNPAAFEKAVRGAASVVHHLHGFGFDSDLWAGGDPVPGRHPGAYERAMEALAGAQLTPDADLRTGAARLRRAGRGGALVIVTGGPDSELLDIHRLMSSDYTRTVLLTVAAAPDDLAEFQRSGAITVDVPIDGSWQEAWIGVREGRKWVTASPS